MDECFKPKRLITRCNALYLSDKKVDEHRSYAINAVCKKEHRSRYVLNRERQQCKGARMGSSQCRPKKLECRMSNVLDMQAEPNVWMLRTTSKSSGYTICTNHTARHLSSSTARLQCAQQSQITSEQVHRTTVDNEAQVREDKPCWTWHLASTDHANICAKPQAKAIGQMICSRGVTGFRSHQEGPSTGVADVRSNHDLSYDRTTGHITIILLRMEIMTQDGKIHVFPHDHTSSCVHLTCHVRCIAADIEVSLLLQKSVDFGGALLEKVLHINLLSAFTREGGQHLEAVAHIVLVRLCDRHPLPSFGSQRTAWFYRLLDNGSNRDLVLLHQGRRGNGVVAGLNLVEAFDKDGERYLVPCLTLRQELKKLGKVVVTSSDLLMEIILIVAHLGHFGFDVVVGRKGRKSRNELSRDWWWARGKESWLPRMFKKRSTSLPALVGQMAMWSPVVQFLSLTVKSSLDSAMDGSLTSRTGSQILPHGLLPGQEVLFHSAGTVVTFASSADSIGTEPVEELGNVANHGVVVLVGVVAETESDVLEVGKRLLGDATSLAEGNVLTADELVKFDGVVGRLALAVGGQNKHGNLVFGEGVEVLKVVFLEISCHGLQAEARRALFCQTRGIVFGSAVLPALEAAPSLCEVGDSAQEESSQDDNVERVELGHVVDRWREGNWTWTREAAKACRTNSQVRCPLAAGAGRAYREDRATDQKSGKDSRVGEDTKTNVQECWVGQGARGLL
ncbi:cytochrome P450 reductase 1, partial [Aureobasidium melanogenum]